MTKEEIDALKTAYFPQIIMQNGITAKDGLLFRRGVAVDLPEADYIAMRCGFACAEQLVKALGGERKEAPIIARKVSNAIMEIGVNE